jgi:two-component system sensor histidine kinase AlgZ
VFERDEFGFPTYWPLQIAGWMCLYVLIVVAILPEIRKPGIFRANTASVLAMFVTSLFLRPVCRSLQKRKSSWIHQETMAFVWSLLAGAIAGLLCEVLVPDLWPMRFSDWLVNSVQSSVVLFLWCSLYFSIKQWQQSARERDRLLRAEAEVRDARLSALRYQLNPHFLFNSLNAVSTLILDGNAPAATRMLAQIGELLRTTLNGEVFAQIPLSAEITFTERYLAIEQTRLGRRLHVEMSIASDTLGALVPSMLLQPLVENAVRHGIAPLIQGGTIQIRSEIVGEHLRISVRNSGAPSRGPAHLGVPSNGIGLRNTAERLRTLYAANHRFDLQWPETGGCEVTIELPFQAATPEAEGSEAVLCAR